MVVVSMLWYVVFYGKCDTLYCLYLYKSYAETCCVVPRVYSDGEQRNLGKACFTFITATQCLIAWALCRFITYDYVAFYQNITFLWFGALESRALSRGFNRILIRNLMRCGWIIAIFFFLFFASHVSVLIRLPH